jgi:hypothetical protein
MIMCRKEGPVKNWLKFFVLFFVFIGCDDDGCKTKETRCNGETSQVCNSNQDWEDMDDCEEAGRGTPISFRCAFDTNLDQHACVVDELPDAGIDGGM